MGVVSLMNKKLKIFLKFFFSLSLLFTFGCSSSGMNEIEIDGKSIVYGECSLEEPKVVTTSTNHIVIEYLLKDKSTIDKVANNWCEKTNKKAIEEKYYCQGCCRSTYQCR